MKNSTIFFISAVICILGSIGFFAANAIAKSPAGNKTNESINCKTKVRLSESCDFPAKIKNIR